MVKHLLFGPYGPVCSGQVKPRCDAVIAFLSAKMMRASAMQHPPRRSVEYIQRRDFGAKRHLASPPQQYRQLAPRYYHQPFPIRPQYPLSAQIHQSRPYHSHFQPIFPTHEYTHSQTAILSAALEHVPEHGFTLEALTLGARDVGFLDVSVQLFPRREFDLVLFWLASRRGLLKGKVEEGLFGQKIDNDMHVGEDTRAGNTSQLSVEEKVKILVMERLRMNEEIVHRWQDVSISPLFPPPLIDSILV